jgi:hypothetical protein
MKTIVHTTPSSSPLSLRAAGLDFLLHIAIDRGPRFDAFFRDGGLIFCCTSQSTQNRRRRFPSVSCRTGFFCCTSQSMEIGGVDFLQYPAGLDFFHCMSQSRPSIHCLHSGWTVFFVARRNGQNGRRPFPQILLHPECHFHNMIQEPSSVKAVRYKRPSITTTPSAHTTLPEVSTRQCFLLWPQYFDPSLVGVSFHTPFFLS